MTKTSLFPLLAALFASPVMAQDAQLHWMDLEGMTPSEIGERALDGLDHGEIVEVEYRRQGMAPPGIHEVQLRELTEREAQGKEADLYRSPPPRVSSP